MANDLEVRFGIRREQSLLRLYRQRIMAGGMGEFELIGSQLGYFSDQEAIECAVRDYGAKRTSVLRF